MNSTNKLVLLALSICAFTACAVAPAESGEAEPKEAVGSEQLALDDDPEQADPELESWEEQLPGMWCRRTGIFGSTIICTDGTWGCVIRSSGNTMGCGYGVR